MPASAGPPKPTAARDNGASPRTTSAGSFSTPTAITSAATWSPRDTCIATRAITGSTRTDGPVYAIVVFAMHHGHLQHRAYLTPYAREKYLKRELDKYLMTGRIYRIVPDGFQRPRPPRLSEEASVDLVKELAHPNGWW